MYISMQKAVRSALKGAQAALEEISARPDIEHTIEAMADELASAFSSGKKALACGNGGSACDAMHFAEEFTGRFRKDRRALPVICISDPAHLTCVGNDYGFENVFSRAVEAYGRPGDVLLAISTSGNSRNVVRAVEEAKKLDMKVLLFLGKNGGALRGHGKGELLVQAETTDRIQEIHMLVLHILIECVERRLFPENYK